MKLIDKIKTEFAHCVSNIYCDNEGASFGKASGTLSWWVELKDGYKVGGYEIVHESTLTDCYRRLKHELYKS